MLYPPSPYKSTSEQALHEASNGAPPIRVLYVISQLGVGGTEKNLVELLLGLNRTKIQPEVLVFEAGGANSDTLLEAQIPLSCIRRKYNSPLDRIIGIYRKCKEFRPHVLHAFNATVGPYCILAGIIARVPVKLAILFSCSLPRRLRSAYRVLWPLLDYMVCNAQAGQTHLVQTCHIPPEKVTVIPNGLDFRRMSEKPARRLSLRSELGLTKQQLFVGLVGKLNDDKNPLLFARAASIVHEEMPDVGYCIIGSGPSHSEVHGFIREVGLSDCFSLVPERALAAWFIQEFDIGVLSSSQEGLPTAVTEYMYWKKPCVVTDVGDCGVVVEHEHTGLVVPRGDHVAFANALLQLLGDPAMRRMMGEAGRRRLGRLYRIERNVTDFERLYVKALRRRTRYHKVLA